MRPETGNNLTIDNKKVSIQVKLGGRSFSADNIALPESTESVEFIIDTPRVVLAPRGEVSLDSADELLRIAGKPCRSNEQSVCSELQADIVAVMAIDSEALRSIAKLNNVAISFTSPLLDMRHCNENCMTMDIVNNVCYARLFDDGLRCAEAFDVASSDDILYIVAEWLNNRDIPIYIKGATEAVKVLRKYYKRVICE